MPHTIASLDTATRPKLGSLRLSIITPVFNGERFLANCIQNVIDQDVKDIEHIIVDGGSTDATLQIVANFQQRHPHIRLIPGPDQGQSDAMNKGIRAALAPVISILNCDDFYEGGAFGDALRIIESLPYPSFVVGNTRVVDENGKTIYWNRPRDLRIESLVLGWWYTTPPMNPSAYFYHKNIHDTVGYYDTADHYTLDQAFVLTCAKRGANMVYVDRHWGNFRLMPGTKTYDDQIKGTALPRMRALYRDYISAFSWKQRLKMHMIWSMKVPRRFAWLVLHRWNLR